MLSCFAIGPTRLPALFMKFLLDFFPIILFFVAYKVWGIYTATAVAIVATVLQIGYLRYRTGKIEPMQWVSLGVIVLFGGATLLAHDENFIKWKPTVLYWAFAAGLTISTLAFGKNLIRSLLGEQMSLPETVWKTLNWSWVAFFLVMGVINLLVAFALGLSTDAWVNFKMFGGMGLMLVFVVGQALYLSRHMESSDDTP